jgi:hypothetical protein
VWSVFLPFYNKKTQRSFVINFTGGIKMVYTIITRRRDGYMNQKIFVDCEMPEAVSAAKIMMQCDKSDYTEIYQDRVPKGDLWGKPVEVVKNG